jgi:integrase
VLHRERSGSFSVRARCKTDGKPSDIGLGVSVRDAADWDGKRQRIRGTAAENSTLAAVDAALADLYTRAAVVDKKPPAKDEVVAVVDAALGRWRPPPDDDPADLFHVFDLFTAHRGRVNSWTEATFKKWAALRRHLERYDPCLRLDRLTEDTLQGFTEHLAGDGLRNTTITRIVEHLRWFLRWAAVAGYYGGNLHETYRPKLKGGKFEAKAVVYLTLDELRRLETYDLSGHPTLAAIRDVFLFGCYSGLRFSDIRALNTADIHGGKIHVVTKKTDDPLTIELNSHTAAILDRWHGRLRNGKALPAISNQKTNDRLKELAKLAGIDSPVHLTYFKGSERYDETVPKWEVLTTHAARRTFVVTALTLGIPAEVIIKWTGHTDYKAMKPYIAIVDSLKAEKMSLFDNIPTVAPRFAPPISYINRKNEVSPSCSISGKNPPK